MKKNIFHFGKSLQKFCYVLKNNRRAAVAQWRDGLASLTVYQPNNVIQIVLSK